MKELRSFTYFHDCRFFAALSESDLILRAREALMQCFSTTSLIPSPLAKSAAIFLLRAWTLGSLFRPPPRFVVTFDVSGFPSSNQALLGGQPSNGILEIDNPRSQ